MMGHVLLAVALSAVPVAARTELSLMTWNVCAGTNPACRLYRATDLELAENVAAQAGGRPVEPGVLFLQEFCTSAAPLLELRLEQRTGRPWTVGSWGLGTADGRPYACHPDRLGRPRGTQSVTVAVAGDAVSFQVHPLPSPPWSATRAALCATIPARRVHACGTHLSSGADYDDRQPGAPYRTRQIAKFLDIAVKPGYRSVLGGDLNVSPPDSGRGSAAGRRAVTPAYRAYRECDQRGARRTGRPTRETRKLDYLFVPRDAVVLRCHIARVALSDHDPVYARVLL